MKRLARYLTHKEGGTKEWSGVESRARAGNSGTDTTGGAGGTRYYIYYQSRATDHKLCAMLCDS